jgi:hypothetical protein
LGEANLPNGRSGKFVGGGEARGGTDKETMKAINILKAIFGLIIHMLHTD